MLEYGAKNYFSFKEGFEVSLRLNKNCPENISHGKDNTNVLCVKGGNGSGKTNVLKALSFIHEFCINSFSYKPDSKSPIEPHFNNSKSTEFFVVFSRKNIEYRYELELTKDKVVSEILYEKDKRYNKIIERTHDSIIYTNKEYSELESMKLRANASLISTAHQYEFATMNKIYSFFDNIQTNVNNIGLSNFVPETSTISKFYKDNDSIFKFVIEQIRSCDIGITNIKILDNEDENGKRIYFPVFYHNTENTTKSLSFHYESSGTKALYIILGLYKLILDSGGVLVLDEFDINLHPHILPKLIDLFDSDKNINDAQLIFTTHNSSIMDILGKYRTVLVNKEENCSYAYRLDELPGDIVRNDRQISKVYNSGKLGGVPKI